MPSAAPRAQVEKEHDHRRTRLPLARPRRAPDARPRVPASTAPLPRLDNPWAPVEILTAEQVERILDAAYRLLEEDGLEIRSAEARAIYRRGRRAGRRRRRRWCGIGRDIVEAALAKAPERFVLHARNPARDLHVGGNVVNFGPVNGAPNIRDLEGGRRYGDIEAFRDVLKVANGLGVLHWQGGVVIEPVDVPVPVRHLDMYRAHIELSDIVWAARGVGGVQAEDALALSAIEHRQHARGSGRRPTLMTVTNVNSPRRVDEEILDNIMIMARHGQCVVITPFTLMGAMAPVTLAGALVQQTAEALGIMALCQIIRPGVPVRDGRLHLECRHAHRLARLRHAGICPCRPGDGADRPSAQAARCAPARSMPARRPTPRRPGRPASRSGRRS